MIRITQPSDINWESLQAVAYDNATVEISADLLDRVERGRAAFVQLIDNGVPCYGVTTGLGQLVKLDLDANQREALPSNILLARAAAIGPPLSRPVARALMLLRLVNFVSAQDGVSAALCQFLVDRLNDGFTPWIPSLGHGMAADAIANTHAFQTFIGEGYVYGVDNTRQSAAEAFKLRGLQPYAPGAKEGLALLNGITAAPAYALDAYRQLQQLLSLSTLVAAASMEGLGASKDAVDLALNSVSVEPGIAEIIDAMQRHLANSEVVAFKLQAPISYRVIPQVHGALVDALASLKQRIENTCIAFSDNPLMVLDDTAAGGRLLSVGTFHNQHLVNQVEQVALALAHLGSLSERRLHRLMNPENTGLNAQLAARPGLDAGLVVTHKASIDLGARLRLLAQPISLATSETSAGQEDYMSMAIPAIARLFEMVELAQAMLAYELLAALVALQQRGQKPGDGVAAVAHYFAETILPREGDRSPGPEVEAILQAFGSDDFQRLLQTL